MREILFRGKKLDGGDWVEGDLIHNDNDYYPVTFIGGVSVSRNEYTHKYADTYCLDGYYLPVVDPDTVGQYTGLTDKNGKRIFEGDILQVKGYGEAIDRCVVGCGIYAPFNHSSKNVGFYLCWKHDKEQLQKYANLAYWVEEREAVCIGNIHDNPELIAEV